MAFLCFFGPPEERADKITTQFLKITQAKNRRFLEALGCPKGCFGAPSASKFGSSGGL